MCRAVSSYRWPVRVGDEGLLAVACEEETFHRLHQATVPAGEGDFATNSSSLYVPADGVSWGDATGVDSFEPLYWTPEVA